MSAKVFNSLPGRYEHLIETWLSALLDCIVKAKTAAPSDLITPWGNSQWPSDPLEPLHKVVSGLSLEQADGHSCGAYAIFNTLVLVQQQEPSLQPVNPREL